MGSGPRGLHGVSARCHVALGSGLVTTSVPVLRDLAVAFHVLVLTVMTKSASLHHVIVSLLFDSLYNLWRRILCFLSCFIHSSLSQLSWKCCHLNQECTKLNLKFGLLDWTDSTTQAKNVGAWEFTNRVSLRGAAPWNQPVYGREEKATAQNN